MQMLPAGRNSRSNREPSASLPPSKPLSRKTGDGGFTLIELLVVIVIVGLLSSFVLFNLPAGTSSARDDAEQIAARLVLASREAVLSGESVGVVLSREGYRFVKRRKQHWQAFDLIPGGAFHPWPERLQVSLRMGGERQLLPRQAALNEGGSPLLYFTPSSESSAFSLSVQKDDMVLVVSCNQLSGIVVGRPG